MLKRRKKKIRKNRNKGNENWKIKEGKWNKKWMKILQMAD